MQWTLSKSTECILCDKFKYTIIFYDRDSKSNPGLTEITDPNFLSEIKGDYIKNYKTYGTQTPIICGTVVKKPFGQSNFSRKLKMIRAPIFTVLCLSGSALFISTKT